MSPSRERFLNSILAADRLCQGTELLDSAPGATSSPVELGLENLGRKFYRNGVAVACFVAFEGFIRGRTAEVANILTTRALPRTAYPSGLLEAARRRAATVLGDMLGRDTPEADIDSAFAELGAAWSTTTGGWTVPHAALLWRGSNVNSASLVEILRTFETASEWSDLTGLVQTLGVAPLPTRELFEKIARERHRAAHESGFSADILNLRTTPSLLLSLAFSFDALLSVGAARIGQRANDSSRQQKGRSAVDLTRLEHRMVGGVNEIWAEYRGPFSAGSIGRARRLWTGELGSVIVDVAGASSSPRDLIVALKTTRTDGRRIVNWRTALG